MKLKGLFAALAIASLGCGTVEILEIGGNTRASGETITGDITTDETWEAGGEYTLEGRVTVKSGVTLTVNPGVIVRAKKDPIGWLQVERGAKIVAEGTAEQPIVFTSAQEVGSRQRGDWGGIVILGRATNNVGTTEVQLEGNGGIHGGTDDADSSGSLKYVRVEYAGFELSPDNELNGITLGSVGSGTELDYIQVHAGQDDGIEWFGGTANGTHLVVSGVRDDCFDTDEGYRGVIQWAVCTQEIGFGDNGVEASNTGGDNLDVTPRAKPQIANFTFVGRGDYEKGNGIRAKEHTAGQAVNGVIVGFNSALDIDDANSQTDTDGDGGVFGFSNIIAYSNGSAATDTVEGNVADDDDEFNEIEAAKSNLFQDPLLGDLSFETPNLLPQSGSPALDCDAPAAPFDTSANYCGAFGTSDWMAGWTSFVDEAPKTLTVVNGDISADTTWTADSTYKLSGKVAVLDGATLTIEPGTVIIAESDPIGWLQINRGAKLNAVGTEDAPIVFTSAKPSSLRQRGDWAGIVILGKSTNNVGTTEVQLEGNGGIHGGTAEDDNSGKIKFVRVEYAGFELSPDNELNGITLGSVGSGTEFSYVQVHRGKDDGIEWFGGSVSGDHLIVSGTGDDCFDTDEGIRGNFQFLVCLQEEGFGDNGIEASNTGGDNLDVSPRANPNFANFTFIGRGDYEKGNGIRAKDGTAGSATNGLIVNFKNAIDIDHVDVPASYTQGGTVFPLSNTILFGNIKAEEATVAGNVSDDDDNGDDDASPQFDEQAYIAAQADISAADPKITEIDFFAPDLLLASDSPALSCASPTGGFETAAYCGAFDDTNDWTAGWANFGQ